MSPTNNIHSIIIVGGGTAGWMTAAALARVLSTAQCKVQLIESDDIGTIGVGEATIPSLATFNNTLGINEAEFMKATQATFKLGIDFVNWKKEGSSYIHPFSQFGTEIDGLPFTHYWQKAFSLGIAPELSEYSLSCLACVNNRFALPQKIANSPLSKISHAYHLDATLYAQYLRKYAEQRGVERTEGKVVSVGQHENGFIKSVTLESGAKFEADFFIDCSGFQGILIEKALESGYDDWSDLLPADSAIAVASEKSYPTTPYTRATAHKVGWQWRIPLQHRTGNGYVYSSKFISDEAAEKLLLENIDTPPLSSPRKIKFTTGKRKEIWKNNCLAVGLASGFVEPLESTSIYLIQSVISKFLALYPQKNNFEPLREKFNTNINYDYESIRDFIILHYKATERKDSEFWSFCRNLEIPETLNKKIELYKNSSQLFRDNNELFSEPSWLAVMHGQGITANHYNPIVDSMPLEELSQRLRKVHSVIKKCSSVLPSHDEFIAKYCQSNITL